MSLKISSTRPDRETNGQAQFFAASFDLMGDVQTGALVLFSPLGTTIAQLNWSPVFATLEQAGQIQNFSSLDAMLRQVTGADIPTASLFAWLKGVDAPAPGWQADLSQLSQGKLLAHRSNPAPLLELRVVLEN